MIVLYRIDNRLLHGQVLEAWIPFLNVNHVGVINDQVSRDMERRAIMTLAAPAGITVVFWGPSEAAREVKALAADGTIRSLLLFPSPHEVSAMIDAGAPPPKEINVGGMHYALGRLSLGRFVTFSEEDKQELLNLAKRGIKLDARATPHDAAQDLLSILKNA